MKENLGGALWRLSAVTAACVFGMFAIFVVFGDLRFEARNEYNAVFTDVSGLRAGDFVRIAGVEAGKVRKVTVLRDSTVNVELSVDNSVVITGGTRALVRYLNVTGDRYLALEDGAGSSEVVHPGGTIPVSQTEPALDINKLIGGFRPLFRALEPDQVNALTGQLIQMLQGQGAMVESFLGYTATFTNTLADRDQLIGEVISNLSTVLDSFGGKAEELDVAVDSVEQLVAGLAERKGDVTDGIANLDSAARSISDLMAEARVPVVDTIRQTDRVAGIVVADNEYLDNLLNTLPDKYQALSRQGLYGDFFSFYLCDIMLKVNGKGGQPVYISVAGQTTGRCTPK